MLNEKREEGPTRVSDGRYPWRRGGASRGFRGARASHSFEELGEVSATVEIDKKAESLRSSSLALSSPARSRQTGGKQIVHFMGSLLLLIIEIEFSAS
jgi:hypothetical protein